MEEIKNKPKCKHVWMRLDKKIDDSSGTRITYLFFCKKCLKIKLKKVAL